jgi:type I restriction enzyme S subunit
LTSKGVAYPFVRLGECGVRVLDCHHLTPKSVSNGFPYVAIPDLKDGRIDLSGVRRIGAEDFVTWTAKTKPQAGDVIVTRRGRVGDTAVVPPSLSCALGQDLVILRSDGLVVDQDYLRYAARGPLWHQEVDRFRNVGAVFGSLNVRDVAKLRIPLPPTSEQGAIAETLGGLDDKIEVNRRISGTIEGIAKALFRSWFVDFDPVRGTATGLDEVRALFSDRLVESSIGLVPEGWRVATVSALASASRESLDPRLYPEEEFDLYSLPAFDAGRMPSIETGSRIKSTKLKVPPGSVLVSKLNPRIPRVWWPQPLGSRPAIASTEFVVALPQAVTTRAYLYGLFTSARFMTSLASLVRGTSGSHQRVSLSDLLCIRVVVPPHEVVARFDVSAAPMFGLQESLAAQSRTLRELRDTLLPKLTSGEIRLGAA